MKAKFITFKSNKDGTATLYFGKGINKHQLIDLEGQEVEINLPRGEYSSEYKAVLQEGIQIGRQQAIDAILSLTTVISEDGVSK